MFEILALQSPTGDASYDEHLRKVQDAARLTPDNPDAWTVVARGWISKARNDNREDLYANAEHAASRALIADPANRAALNIRGIVHLNAHRFDAARKVAEQVLEADAADPMALGTLSDALLELGDYDASEAAVQRMIDAKPSLPSYARAAHLKWLRGDNAAAKELYRLAFGAGRGHSDREPAAWTLVEVANIFLHEGDIEGAAAGYDLALKHLPDYWGANLGKARVAMAQQRWADAVEALKAARAAKPKDLTVVWSLGVAADKAGDDEVARKAYVAADALAQEDIIVGVHYRAYRAANASELTAAIEPELQKRPNNVWVAAAAAHAYAAAGRESDAAAQLAQARRLGTQDPRLAYLSVLTGAPDAQTHATALVDKHTRWLPAEPGTSAFEYAGKWLSER